MEIQIAAEGPPLARQVPIALPKRTAHGRKRAKDVIRFIEALRVPSGHGAGKNFKLAKWQKDFIKDIYEPHYSDGRRAVRRAILSVARKNGKLLSLDTPIPTPSGFVRNGDLKIGDKVFDENGNICQVTFISPVTLGERCFKIGFADGSSIVAGASHQWLTRHSYRPWAEPTFYPNSNKRRGGSGNGSNWRIGVLTTSQIAASVRRPRADGGVEYNHKLPVAQALDTPYANLLLSPYVLGYWLGNGSKRAAEVVSGLADGAEIQSYLQAELEFTTPLRVDLKGGGGTSVRHGLSHTDHRGESIAALRAIGVLNDKHIPHAYLWASAEQRLALLQGLMDSDGSVSGNPKSPRCYFDNTNERLARDVLFLVRSLGLKASLRKDRATLYGRDLGPAYSVTFTAFREDAVFRLKRKFESLISRPANSMRSRSNAIISCEEVPSVATRCIQVDSPSHLYLAGEGLTPTHNTALIAGLVLAHLIGPEREPRGEIYSAANDRDQASIVYKFARQLVEQDPRLLNAVQLVPSTKTIVAPGTGSVYRAISAEAGTKHGYLPSVVIYDELAQAKGRALYDVLDTSFGARREPLFITISTQSNDPEHILSKLIDDGLSGLDPSIICHLYAADEDCDLEDEDQWKKANPALGDFRDREDLAAAIRKATRLPAEEPKVRNLFLNQRVAPVATFIAKQTWMDCAGDVAIADGEEVYLGLDLSASLDLTALVLVSAFDPARVVPFFWKPADTMREHSDRDFGVNNQRYWAWCQNGHLLKSPGNSVDPEVVARKVGELFMRYKVKGLAYDRWRMDVLLREFDDIGLACYREKTADNDGLPRERGIGLRCVPWGQGFKDMAPAIDAFEQAVIDHKLVHPNNPVLNWNMANAVATMDPAGNRKLDKGKARFRIDGAVALAMAMGLRARDREKAKPVDIEALIA